MLSSIKTSLKELKKAQATLEGELEVLVNASSMITKEFDGYRRELANLVRSITSYKQSYNYIQIYNRYKQVKSPAVSVLEVKEKLREIAALYAKFPRVQAVLDVDMTSEFTKEECGALNEILSL